MFDLKITGGTVVDGTGADRFRADIGVKDGRIVEVRRRDGDDPGLEGDAAETHRRDRSLVAPGFVDIHTHYDGQVSWDRDAWSRRACTASPPWSAATAASGSRRSAPAANSG